jgi:hypothetical protein
MQGMILSLTFIFVVIHRSEMLFNPQRVLCVKTSRTSLLVSKISGVSLAEVEHKEITHTTRPDPSNRDIRSAGDHSDGQAN